MTIESSIDRIEYNDVEQAAKLVSYVNRVVGSLLGEMLVELYPLTMTTPSTGTVYSLKVTTNNVDTSAVVSETLTYTSVAGDTEQDVYNMLAGQSTEASTFELGFRNNKIGVFGKDAEIVDGIEDLQALSLSSNREWFPSGTPACYQSYMEIPKADYPSIIITPLAVVPICDKMEETVIGTITDPTEITSSYIRYSFQLVCHAGKRTDVLRSGVSAQYILNRLRKCLASIEMERKLLQNMMNSVLESMSSVTPTVIQGDVHDHDSATLNLTFTATDMIIPIEPAGFVTKVRIEDEGIIYKTSPEDPNPLRKEMELVVDRTEIIPD